MRKLLVASVAAILALSACSATEQPNGVAVRGYQAPGGWNVVAQQKVADHADVAPGSSAYMGMSADGSLVGFIFSDGTIKWYRTSAR
jgi:hypothetical protein